MSPRHPRPASREDMFYTGVAEDGEAVSIPHLPHPRVAPFGRHPAPREWPPDADFEAIQEARDEARAEAAADREVEW